MCQKAVAWGYDGIEFRGSMNGYSPKAYLDAIARESESSGLKNVLFSFGPELMSSDADLRRKNLDDQAAFLEMAAKRFELKTLNTFCGELRDSSIPYTHYDKNGSAIASEEQWHWAAEGYKLLGKIAASHGIKLAFETHMCYIHDLHTSAKRLVNMIGMDSVGVNLDYCNILNFQAQPSLKEVIETCGDNLYHVHLKNMFVIPDRLYNKAIRCPLKDGIINNRELLRMLKQRGYTGFICLESPRAGDREVYAQDDLAYIKNVMNNL